VYNSGIANGGLGVTMTIDEIIDRALDEGLTEQQIAHVVEVWTSTNLYRIARGYPPVGLEDAMPRYVLVSE
jgi:hypothetical protein